MLKTVNNGGVLFIAEQYLHRAKAFSDFYTAALARGLGVHGKVEGDTPRTSDPS